MIIPENINYTECRKRCTE